jgi:AmmeMemoRadiSam system protein B
MARQRHRDGERDLIVVNDPLGVMPAPIALRMESLELLRVLDGTFSLNDLAAEVVRASQDIRAGNYVKEFVGQLDRMLMLESPRFDAAYRALRDDYHRMEIRQAMLGGVSYPAGAAEAGTFVDEHFAAAERMRAEAGDPPVRADARPKALLVPHLDPRRAGPVIARAYLELGAATAAPLRVIVFGTGHSLFGDAFALTRKHFETPFGPLQCDTAFVDALAATLGDDAYHGELVHRDEHSIEFQALYLMRRFAGRPLTLVPILCGGFHALLDDGKTPRDDPRFEAMIAAVRETTIRFGGDTVMVGAVDLSHVGPRFGDPAVDDRVRAEVAEKDHAALDAARRGDADGWYQAIAAHEDSTRVCGWGATYALLRAAEPGPGRLVRYENSEESDGSLVTVAAMVWP